MIRNKPLDDVMPRIVMILALAAYAVGVLGRSVQTMVVRWDAGLPFEMLVGGSVGEGLAWPRDLIQYLL